MRYVELNFIKSYICGHTVRSCYNLRYDKSNSAEKRAGTLLINN